MEKIILPSRLETLIIDGKKVDWELPCLLFCPSTDNKSVLEQLMYKFGYRGAEETEIRPFESPKLDHPLTLVFAGQLALRDIVQQELNNAYNIAKYFASENAIIMPPTCDDAISEYQVRFQNADELLEKWTPINNITVEEIGDKFNECIKPEGQISLLRLRISKVIALFNKFLDGDKYNKYTKEENCDHYLEFLSYFDAIRRGMRDSIRDTWLHSENAINRLKDEFYAEPMLARARAADIYTLNHVHLEGLVKEEEIPGYYKNVRQIYLDFIKTAYKKEEIISAYASLIAYDMLIGDNQLETHLQELERIAPNHPKTALVRQLAGDSKDINLMTPKIKLSFVGLRQYYHPRLLEILLAKLEAFKADHTCVSPYVHHRMNDFLDYCQTTKLTSMKRKNGKITFEFSQKPYIRFQNEIDISEDGKQIVVAPDAKLLKKMYGFGGISGSFRLIKNRFNIEKLAAICAATCVDRYLLHPPLVMHKGFGLGSETYVE